MGDFRLMVLPNMTHREFFAGLFFAAFHVEDYSGDRPFTKERAENCVRNADILIKALREIPENF